MTTTGSDVALSLRLRSFVIVLALVLSSTGTIGTVRASSGWVQQNVTTPTAIGPVVYDTTRHVALMFNRTQTWQWSTASATWTQITPVHEPMMLGGDLAMAFDSTRGVAVLIVSPVTNVPGPTDILSTWEWDGADWTQRQPLHSPPPRFDHSQNLAFDSQRSVTVLVTGQFDIDHLSGDTWEWNGIDWTQNVTAYGPSKRFSHCMAYDSDRHRVVLRGGVENNGSGGGTDFDTWEYDGASWFHTYDPPTSPFYYTNGCSTSYDHAIARTINLANSSISGAILTFYWDGQTWTKVGPDGPVIFGLSTFDPDNNVVVLVGSGQTWLLNPLPPPPGPGPAPVITKISPDHGLPAGGTTVTITGVNFTGATFMSFHSGSAGLQPCGPSNLLPYCFTVDSDTQITATSPPMDIGAFDVYVVTPNGISAFSPVDVFTNEGWETPADNSTINVPMTNPPQKTTFIVRLLESGTPSIGFSNLPPWLTCLKAVNPIPDTAEVDCSADPTDMTPGRIFFSDAVDVTRVPILTVNLNVVHQGYRPIPDGYAFPNDTGDSSVSAAVIAADYPDSAGEILYPLTQVGTAKEKAFELLFQYFQSGGLCYGMAASSAYFYNDFGGTPFTPYPRFTNLNANLPFAYDNRNPGFLKTLIERYHSRQLAQLGAYDGIQRFNDASAIGNAGVFNQLASQVTHAPETVAIVPTKAVFNKDHRRYADLFYVAHVVVAYDTTTANGQQVKVYDPNSSGDPRSLLTFTADGGLTLTDGNGKTTYGGGTANDTNGLPIEWLAVPLPDFTWLDGSSESIAPTFTIDNKHWLLDLPSSPILFFLAALPGSPAGLATLLAGASARLPMQVDQLPSGGTFSGSVSTLGTNSTVGQFTGNHVALATETDPGAAGTSHSLDIDPTASGLHLYGATSAQQYTLQLGADYLPNYGRRVTLTGVNLAPNATVDMKTNANTNGFTLSSSGASQTVPATIEQLGQSSGSATVQVSIPGSGGQATVTVFDWTDVAHSLIYETSQVNGQQTVTILQDNPAERPAAIDGLFQQLTATIRTISDPDLVKVLTAAVQIAQLFFHRGDHKTAAATLVALERATTALAGKKIPAATAALIVSLSQQIRGLL